jgi:hypothetical protein
MATNMQGDVHRPLSRPDLLAWGTVRSGLAVTFAGGLMVFLSAGVLFVVDIASKGNLHGASMLTILIAVLSGLGVCAGMVLALVGACMGSAAPQESAVRSWGYASCAFAVLTVAAFVVLAVAILDQQQIEFLRAQQDTPADLLGNAREPAPPKVDHQPALGPEEITMVGYVLQGVFVLGACCYFLSLHALARHFRRDGLAVGVVCYLLFFLLFVAGMNVLAHTRAQGADDVERTKVAAWLVLGGTGILGAWGLVLVGMVRGTLTEGLLRG